MANPIDRIFESISAGDPSVTPANSAESFFDSIGLMRGTFAPAGRALFGVAVGAVLMYAIRPSFAFNSDGSPKSNARIPWWSIPVAIGAVCGVFV